MGAYVYIRGWLECDREQCEAIRRLIAADDDPYNQGWSFSEWSAWGTYVFYGGGLRESGHDWFLDQLNRIAQLPGTQIDDDRITGLFLVTHEGTGRTQWQVRDGSVVLAPASGYAYLDE